MKGLGELEMYTRLLQFFFSMFMFLFRYSNFLPQSKDMHVRLTGGSNLPVGVIVSVHSCLSTCDPVMDW